VGTHSRKYHNYVSVFTILVPISYFGIFSSQCKLTCFFLLPYALYIKAVYGLWFNGASYSENESNDCFDIGDIHLLNSGGPLYIAL